MDVLYQRKSSSELESVSEVRIRAPNPDDFHNLLGNWEVPKYIYDKIFLKIPTVFPEIRAKLWENALSRNVEEYFKNSGSGSTCG